MFDGGRGGRGCGADVHLPAAETHECCAGCRDDVLDGWGGGAEFDDGLAGEDDPVGGREVAVVRGPAW